MPITAFLTDSTLCIGCKACEVACKEWNQLPAENGGVRELSGNSYDNTRRLDGIHWRHVKFVEQFSADRRDGRWLMNFYDPDGSRTELMEKALQDTLPAMTVMPPPVTAP